MFLYLFIANIQDDNGLSIAITSHTPLPSRLFLFHNACPPIGLKFSIILNSLDEHYS